MKSYEIIHGDALSVLQGMASEFVDCVVTSPPYYGLRSYGTEPQVWGDKDCQHVWGESLAFAKQDNRTAEQKATQGAVVGSNINFNESTTTATSGNFCQICNAWRGELGLEPTFGLYIEHLIDIFREVKRVLKPTGTVWVNLGDSYGTQSGNAKDIAKGKIVQYGAVDYHEAIAPTNKPNGYHKSLLNIPARFAIAMTDELQFIQRNTIIWHKKACMPSSAKDRFTVDFENIFFFTKSPKYYFEQQLEPLADISIARVSQPNYLNQAGSIGNGGAKTNGPMKAVIGSLEGRNMRTTWDIPFEPQSSEHYAAYPTKLVERMIQAGCSPDGIVLDPFNGTGTTGVVAVQHRKHYIGIELQEKYIDIAKRRLDKVQVNLF